MTHMDSHICEYMHNACFKIKLDKTWSYEVQQLSEKVLATDDTERGGGQFSSEMESLLTLYATVGGLYNYLCTNHIKQTQ